MIRGLVLVLALSRWVFLSQAVVRLWRCVKNTGKLMSIKRLEEGQCVMGPASEMALSVTKPGPGDSAAEHDGQMEDIPAKCWRVVPASPRTVHERV